jgi:hypothetical protein
MGTMKELRDRVITVRLTESEYRRLKSTCGADENSISHTVRQTVLEWAGARAGRRQSTDDLLSQISHRLDKLISILNKERP